jgi:hypothetical protein
MQPSESLVTIATFSFPTEAYLLQGKLESEAIWSTVVDAETVTMNWLWSNAIGGVKLKVRREDVSRARELIRPAIDEPADNIDSVQNDNCPECGSSNTEFEKFNRKLAFLTWLLLWVPLPFWRNKWVCQDCGHTWKADSANKRAGAP